MEGVEEIHTPLADETPASCVSSSPPSSPPLSLPEQASVSPSMTSSVYAWKGFSGDLSLHAYSILAQHEIHSIAAGGGHVLFLTKAGCIFGRGHNAHGQLGLGKEYLGIAQAEPRLISALEGHTVVAVSAGRSHSAAVCSTGQVFCWGDSAEGQCGTGSLEKVLTPTEVRVTIQEGFCEHGIPKPEVPVAIENVVCGATHTLALSVDDEVWAWGCGEQLGLEDLLHAPLPRRIETLMGRRVLMVACGDSHSMALVQKPERAHQAHLSPSRHRKVCKEAVVTQKYYPSLCSRCNKEIYTYTETNDTCIIDAVHECQVEDSGISSESCGLGADDECCTSSSQGSSEKLVPGSLVMDEYLVGHDQSLEPQLKHARESEGADEGQEQGFGDAVLVKSQTPAAQKLIGSSGEKHAPGHRLNEDSDDVFEKSSVQNIGQSTAQPGTQTVGVVGAQSTQAQDASKPSLSSVSSVDSNGDVWQRQSVVQEGVMHCEEKVTCLDGAGSPQTNSLACSRTPSGGTTASMSKLKGLLDEQQARQYLARQLSDEIPNSSDSHPTHPTKEEEVKEKAKTTAQPTVQETSHSSWKSFLPYSTSMFETVKTITSKALDNIQNTVDSLVGQQNLELGDMFENKSKSSHDSVTPAVTASDAHAGAESGVMTDSNSSMEFGPEVSYSSQLHGSGRSSVSPLNMPAAAPAEEEFSGARQSLRTIELKQQNLQRKTSTSGSTSKESDTVSESPANIIFDTEVWVWGDNQKGQLGLGDSQNRSKPVGVKVLSNKCVMKIAAGANHSLALTCNSQVYSWGSNSYNQLGHSDQGISPARIKFMKGCCLWDVAAGTNHSIFLADAGSIKPAVFYCGKQPGKDVYSTLQKASIPTSVNDLKKLGWIRQVASGGDNCYCLIEPTEAATASAVYELASSERAFYQEMVKTNTLLLRPLSKSSFYNVMDVFPFKSALHNLVAAFIALTKKVGEGIVDLTEVVRENEDLMSANFFRFSSQFVEEFRRYSTFFADFLSIGGFEYSARIGSEFFDKYETRDCPQSAGEDKKEKPVSRFRSSMHYPFFRLKEYSRLLQKIADRFEVNSNASNLLQKAVLEWDSLKLTVTAEHKLADTTRAFWEGASPRLTDALRIPSRRMLRDSKTHPLLMVTAGRFSSHLFVLFNDMFVHLQSNSHSIFPLETTWVETPVTDSDQNHIMVIISPEDRIELCASSSAEKAEWVMALNSAINKALCSQRDVGRRGSTERLTPPLVRHATHTFVKHHRWKDGIYVGTFLSGKLHGHGEIKWMDGRRYTGKFKHGLHNGQGVFVIPRGGASKEIQEGNWKDGKLNGLGCIKYANRDEYKGYFKDGERFGHGVLKQGRHLSSAASVYVGEWLDDRRQGYGVQDDIFKGEKYMGQWVEDHRHGNGIMVTLDGMYFEGNFYIDKLMGFGLMLTDDNSCYEGEFQDITQLAGKGTLTLPTGDKLEGTFNGSWNEGLKVSGTFIKCTTSTPERHSQFSQGIKSKYYGQLSVKADQKWEDIFRHCYATLGHDTDGRTNTAKAWEVVAVAVSSGKKQLKEMQQKSTVKSKIQVAGLEMLETIPPQGGGSLTTESFSAITSYLRKAFDTTYHPLGQLMESLVDVFRAAYVGVGAHPRLLQHAVSEVRSYIRRIYQVVRILFPELPAHGGPLHVYPKDFKHAPIPTSTEEVNTFLQQHHEQDFIGKIITASGLLYPILLPKIYPPLFDLYALYNDKDDERYWERITRLNRQGDMALMAYLGIDQKFWLMDDILLEDKNQKLSSTKDVCYASAVDALQQLSTAFSPLEKLLVIENTFNEITQTVQASLGNQIVWCMDDLFPIFQFVVVRAKIHHLGAEINMVDDLMEPHMEHGELGIMFTTLKACYFQIQNEKMPQH